MVEVKVQQFDKCHAQLEVSRENQTWFLMPKTHILIRRGVQKPCNPALPSYFRIGNVWYKMMPRPIEAMPPIVINPVINSTWKYRNAANLAEGGIYTEKELGQMRDHINFPMEQPSILNVITRYLGGRQTNSENPMTDFLDDKDICERLAEGAGAKLWEKFMTFGTASAGIIMILLIIQFAKVLIDTAIRGYTLHSIYGWSVHLIGAVFASITALLIHMGNSDTQPPQNEVEMQTPYAPVPVLIETKSPESGRYPNIVQHELQPQNAHTQEFLSLGR